MLRRRCFRAGWTQAAAGRSSPAERQTITDTQSTTRRLRQIEDTSTAVRTAVVNANPNGFAGLQIGNSYQGPERQASMCGRELS